MQSDHTELREKVRGKTFDYFDYSIEKYGDIMKIVLEENKKIDPLEEKKSFTDVFHDADKSFKEILVDWEKLQTKFLEFDGICHIHNRVKTHLEQDASDILKQYVEGLAEMVTIVRDAYRAGFHHVLGILVCYETNLPLVETEDDKKYVRTIFYESLLFARNVWFDCTVAANALNSEMTNSDGITSEMIEWLKHSKVSGENPDILKMRSLCIGSPSFIPKLHAKVFVVMNDSDRENHHTKYHGKSNVKSCKYCHLISTNRHSMDSHCFNLGLSLSKYSQNKTIKCPIFTKDNPECN